MNGERERREDALAVLLEQPPGVRESDDPELAALLAVAERVDSAWSEIEPEAGAAERVWREAERRRQAASRRLGSVLGLPSLPRMGWVLRAGALAATLVAMFVAVNLIGRGPGSEEILERARATISIEGRIVHIESTTTTRTVFNGRPFTTSESTQAWTLERGGVVLSRELVRDEDGLRRETVVTETEQRTYDADDDTITVRPAPRRGSGARRPVRGADPLATVRAALGSGDVESVEEGELRGRDVYRFKRTFPAEGGSNVLTYTFDQETFAPLELEQRVIIVDEEGRSDTTSTTRLREFEVLAPTSRNLELLEMAPHPGAKVVREGS